MMIDGNHGPNTKLQQAAGMEHPNGMGAGGTAKHPALCVKLSGLLLIDDDGCGTSGT